MKSYMSDAGTAPSGAVPFQISRFLQTICKDTDCLPTETTEEPQIEALSEDEHCIKAYFERYANADLDDETVRDLVLLCGRWLRCCIL